MSLTINPARRIGRSDRPFNPRHHCADNPLGPPIGPGEQARLVEHFRIAVAARAQEWRTARRSRRQAGSLTSQSGLRAWRAA